MHGFKANTHYLGIGIVAENKPRDTDIVEVWPLEIIPEFNDDVTPATEDYVVTAVDCLHQPYKVTLKRGATIPCTWIRETNRKTSPDVRRGERVEIYRVGDSEQYYWRSCGRDDHLRRLETIIITASDIPVNDNSELDDTNTWSIELNTHEGHLTIRTTMSNGEVAAWTIQADGADGKFTVEDQKGNHVFIDSPNDHIQLKNAAESFLELNKKNITAECLETFRLKCKDAVIDTQTTKWTNAKSWALDTDTYTVNAGATAELKAGSTVTISGSVVKIN